AANMIDVSVRDDDLLHFQVVLSDDSDDLFDVIAGIDDHGFARCFIADDRAVAMQRPDREDFMNHQIEFSVLGSKSQRYTRYREPGTENRSHDAAANCPVRF